MTTIHTYSNVVDSVENSLYCVPVDLQSVVRRSQFVCFDGYMGKVSVLSHNLLDYVLHMKDL